MRMDLGLKSKHSNLGMEQCLTGQQGMEQGLMAEVKSGIRPNEKNGSAELGLMKNYKETIL